MRRQCRRRGFSSVWRCSCMLHETGNFFKCSRFLIRVKLVPCCESLPLISCCSQLSLACWSPPINLLTTRVEWAEESFLFLCFSIFQSSRMYRRKISRRIRCISKVYQQSFSNRKLNFYLSSRRHYDSPRICKPTAVTSLASNDSSHQINKIATFFMWLWVFLCR